MFIHETSVKLHQTDAAGLLFFGHQLTICHDAYELFMESIDADFATIFRSKDYYLAIVHAEADFRKPLFVGDRLRIELSVARAGVSSYTLVYNILNDQGELVGTGQTVHVCVDKKNSRSQSLPPELKESLEKHLQSTD